MIDINNWIKIFTKKVESTFNSRIWFIGLQGSYGRGEANDKSDIDVVVILDKLNINDLKIYRDMLDTLPNRDLVCGFISGKDELLNWEKSDLFQFYYDTTPIKGTLDVLLEKIDKQSVRRAIHLGACNIYHACAHNYIHERSNDILCSLYKSAIFVIQAISFYQKEKYVKSKNQLKKIPAFSAILDIEQKLKMGENVNFEQISTLLFDWSKSIILEYNNGKSK